MQASDIITTIVQSTLYTKDKLSYGILITLANNMNDKSGQASVSLQQLADTLGTSRASIYRRIIKLSAQGILERRDNPNGVTQADLITINTNMISTHYS